MKLHLASLFSGADEQVKKTAWINQESRAADDCGETLATFPLS